MEYAEGIRTLAERCPLFSGKDLHVYLIANPVAGGFAIKKRAAQNRKFLDNALESGISRPVVCKASTSLLLNTRSSGHAGELALGILRTALADDSADSMYLLVTAGGDGTSLEVLSAYARICLDEGNTRLAEKVCILRLPFGTGNDGSDGRTLDQTLSLLTGESAFARQCAVRVRSSSGNGSGWFSFNIASIGIDAFITDMTNQVKGVLPGNFYKIWIDIACLFYSMFYTIGKMTVVMSNRDGTKAQSHSGRLLLALMGVSGRRTYGSNQKILPDDNNVCGVREMPLLRKLKLKKSFTIGNHAHFPETILCRAEKMVVYYGERILVQLDGEAHLLYPADFPLTMELTEPFITIIRPLKEISAIAV